MKNLHEVELVVEVQRSGETPWCDREIFEHPRQCEGRKKSGRNVICFHSAGFRLEEGNPGSPFNNDDNNNFNIARFLKRLERSVR